MVNRRWLIGIDRNQRLLWAAIVLAACQTGDLGQFRNTSDQQRITAIDYTSAACPQRMLQTNSMLKCKRSLWDGREWSSKGISRHCSANWSFHSFVILHFYNFRGLIEWYTLCTTQSTQSAKPDDCSFVFVCARGPRAICEFALRSLKIVRR